MWERPPKAGRRLPSATPVVPSRHAFWWSCAQVTAVAKYFEYHPFLKEKVPQVSQLPLIMLLPPPRILSLVRILPRCQDPPHFLHFMSSSLLPNQTPSALTSALLYFSHDLCQSRFILIDLCMALAPSYTLYSSKTRSHLSFYLPREPIPALRMVYPAGSVLLTERCEVHHTSYSVVNECLSYEWMSKCMKGRRRGSAMGGVRAAWSFAQSSRAEGLPRFLPTLHDVLQSPLLATSSAPCTPQGTRSWTLPLSLPGNSPSPALTAALTAMKQLRRRRRRGRGGQRCVSPAVAEATCMTWTLDMTRPLRSKQRMISPLREAGHLHLWAQGTRCICKWTSACRWAHSISTPSLPLPLPGPSTIQGA